MYLKSTINAENYVNSSVPVTFIKKSSSYAPSIEFGVVAFGISVVIGKGDGKVMAA